MAFAVHMSSQAFSNVALSMVLFGETVFSKVGGIT